MVLDPAGDAADVREFLIDAAIACDFETLASLAWSDVPENPWGWGMFWGTTNLTASDLRRIDATQNATWDLAVALIYTEPTGDASECDNGMWHCGLEWYEWPLSQGRGPSDFSSHTLERLALLDGTTPDVFAARLLNGYSTFSVVVSTDGRWMAARAPSPGDCEAEPGSAIDLVDEPDSLRDFAWTDDSGCLIRIDVIHEQLVDEHCGIDNVRLFFTGDELGTRFSSTDPPATYIRDPSGTYLNDYVTDGFEKLEELPPDATYSGFRLRDRELWISPSDPNVLLLKDSDSVERWPRGVLPPCF